MKSSSSVLIISEGALCVALSIVLNYLTLFRMPQGGSINLELLPLLIFAYRHGFKWGIVTGALVGLLQIWFGGAYVAHPIQALLDYILAYSAMGFAGLWRKHLIAGTVLAGATCFSCYIISGVVFFASYAPEGTSPIMYSLIYNSSFFFPQLILNTIAALLIYRRLKNVYPSV